MTVLLIKRLIWGDKDALEAVIDEIVELDNECSETEEVSETKDDKQPIEDADKDVDDEDTEEAVDDEDTEEVVDDEDTEEAVDEEEVKDDDEDETECNEGRYRFDMIHSQFQFEVFREIFASPQFQIFYKFYLFLMFASISIATYDFINKSFLFSDSLSTSTIYVCLDTPTIHSYLTYGASIVTRLPYTPALLLGISYMSPEMCQTLDTNVNSYACENRLFLWVQFALQSLITVGSINPDVAWVQETSAALAFILLYNFFSLMTPIVSKKSIDSYTASCAIAICMFGLLSIQYIPVMLSGFIVAFSLEFTIPGAFNLLTPDGRLVLLKCLILSSAIMLLETVNVIDNNGLGFNLVFWQACGSVVDIIVLSPRPGRFITAD
jgi:hypothetical protein